VVPVAAIVMCLSGPAVSTLFGNKYASAPLFLALLAITYTYTALGSLSAGNLINSQGQTTLMLKLSLIDVSIGFPMGYLLIMNFGVLGLIVTASTAGLPSYFLLLYWIKKRYSLTVEWHSSAKIILSSAIAALSTYAFVGLLGFAASWIRLTVGVVFFLAIFVLVALMTRTLEMSDISNLHEMTSNLGFVGKLSDSLLNLLERIMHALKLK
jgi:O-antigen/teichoic acid export membrane protein